MGNASRPHRAGNITEFENCGDATFGPMDSATAHRGRARPTSFSPYPVVGEPLKWFFGFFLNTRHGDLSLKVLVNRSN